MKKDHSAYGMFNFSAVLKGVLLALVITILGSALLGTVYQVTSLAERTLPTTSTVLFFLSIIVGSFIAARNAGARGLLHGFAVGIIFWLVGWLLSGIFFDLKAATGNLFIKGGLSGIAGAVSGVIGVSSFSR